MSKLDQLKAKRIAATQQRLQQNEQHLLSARSGGDPTAHAPTILVPTSTGEMLETAEYQLRQRDDGIQRSVHAELEAFKHELDTGKWEVVENRSDEAYSGMLNGISFVVPAHSSKRLPAILAQHYHKQKSYKDRHDKYEHDTGARGAGQPDSIMPLKDFKNAVKSLEGIGVDLAERRYFY